MSTEQKGHGGGHSPGAEGLGGDPGFGSALGRERGPVLDPPGVYVHLSGCWWAQHLPQGTLWGEGLEARGTGGRKEPSYCPLPKDRRVRHG